jgi:hypothetical protein
MASMMVRRSSEPPSEPTLTLHGRRSVDLHGKLKCECLDRDVVKCVRVRLLFVKTAFPRVEETRLYHWKSHSDGGGPILMG